MPRYRVKQVETYLTSFEITADSEGEAIQKVWDGDIDIIQLGSEFWEVNNDQGMPIGELTEKDAATLDISHFDFVPGIYSVEEY